MSSRVARRDLLGSLLALAAGAELLRPRPGAAQSSALEGAVEAGNRQFLDALRRGDAAGCAAVYANDARVMPPNSPMQTGRKAIEAFWDSAIKSGIKDATLTSVALEQHRSILLEIGTYTLDIQPPGKPPKKDEGKYVVVWKRHARVWRISVDIFNSDLPVA